jgi:hypothetical protein
MCIRLASTVVTDDFKNPNTPLDTLWAAGQAAITVALGNKYGILPSFVNTSLMTISSGALSNVVAAAIIGASIKLAYKVSERPLNWVFKDLQKMIDSPMTVKVLRKIVEIGVAASLVTLAALVVSVALPTICSATSISISESFLTYLAFSALGNLRFGMSSEIDSKEEANSYRQLSDSDRSEVRFGPQVNVYVNENGTLKYEARLF